MTFSQNDDRPFPSLPEAEIGLLLEALVYAAAQHRAQHRKGADHVPYINHPIEVATTLWTVGGIRSVNVLAAALLHDVVEDTTTTFADLEVRFGPTITALVREVTDDKSLPQATRKDLQVTHAPHKSTAAKAIKLADKIHNVRDLAASPPLEWPPERLIAYVDWAARVADGLRGEHERLDQCFDNTLALARVRLGLSSTNG